MPTDLPLATRNLLIANVAVFLLQQVAGQMLLFHFALWPWGPDISDGVDTVGFRPWQLISYAFMHGSIMHIVFNMLGLFMFGGTIERVLGARRFVLYYLVCAVAAGLAQQIINAVWLHEIYPTLGASGSVFGVLLAFGLFFPREKMIVFPLPIPMAALPLVLIYAVIELFLGVTGSQPGVAHFAHLGGMLGGYLLIQFWRGRFPIKPRYRLMY